MSSAHASSRMAIGFALRVCITGCSAAPVGTIDGRVPSRYVGEPLAVVRVTQDGRTAKVAAAGQGGHQSHQSYLVQKGDTLWSISRRFSTSVDEIMKGNAIEAPEGLRAGIQIQVLRAVPSPIEKPTSTDALAKPGSFSRTKQPVARTGRRYPLRWPVEGVITSRYGKRGGRNHDGIDIGAAKGLNVVAAAAGEVIFASKQGGYGKLILVRHKGGIITVYAHNDRNLVRKGQSVKAGQIIGKVGETGRATGPHLHFEVRRGVRPENPLRFLPP